MALMVSEILFEFMHKKMSHLSVSAFCAKNS